MSTIDIEAIAKSALDVAAGVVTGISPVAGMLITGVAKIAFSVIDLEKTNKDPKAAAQVAADGLVDMVEQIKLGTP